jgi:5S rRNA maturation endonuclease (ribonuclease M5)
VHEKSYSIEEMDEILEGIVVEGKTHEDNQRTAMHSQDDSVNINREGVAEEVEGQRDRVRLEDLLLSKERILFGGVPLLPGAIEEVDFSVILNSKQPA